MSNKEILEAAITKAIGGGWKPKYKVTYLFEPMKLGAPLKSSTTPDAHSFIFNHDFAKALWGETVHEVAAIFEGKPFGKMSWQHHLQRMVIADDPIKYLGENI